MSTLTSTVRSAVLAAAVFVLAGARLAAEPGYPMMPGAGPDHVVFTCEGDLWTVPLGGGSARRLTRHPGMERFARFSPDGRTIAFTASWQGGEDVYVMPAGGGVPRRLTHHPDPDQVVGWLPDGSAVVFRSPRHTAHGSQQLWTVPTGGGRPSLLPLGEAALVAFSGDGRRAVFNRSSREFRYWKRYRGGTQQDLWWADLQSRSYRRLTADAFRGTDGFPMWIRDRIYFASDRDGVMNIYSMDEEGRDVRQHTRHTEFDVRWPSAFGDRIVYTAGARLHVLEVTGLSQREVPLDVPSDRMFTLPRFVTAAKHLDDPILTPDGRRVLLPVRGDLLLAAPGPDPARLVNLTRTDGARERAPDVSPDGRQVVCLSDASGEEEVVILSIDGSGATTAITSGPGHWRFGPLWSPDGERLAWADQTMALWVHEIKTRSARRVAASSVAEINEYAWSPDGRWLAFAIPEENRMRGIHVWSVRSGQTHRITEGESDCYSPAWDPEGKYLYFLSDRTLNPIMDTLDYSAIFDNTTRPYLVLLRKGVKSPFFPREPEEEQAAEEKDKDKDKDRRGQGGPPSTASAGSAPGGLSVSPAGPFPSPVPSPGAPAAPSASPAPRTPAATVEIDLDGIQDRIVALPVEPGHLSGLGAVKGKVLYMSRPTAGLLDDGDHLSRDRVPRRSLMAFDLAERETKPLAEAIFSYALSRDGKKVVVHRTDEVKVFEVDKAPDGGRDEKGKKKEGKDSSRKKGIVALDSIRVRIDPRAEWGQIFREAWRLQREFYWAPTMAGIDWEAMRRRHAPLLDRVATRGELSDLIGEMFGELATSHTYVFGGDGGPWDSKPVEGGLLGADLEPERTRGGWRVTRVLKGSNWHDESLAPLAAPHTGIEAGDVVVAVDRRKLGPDDDLDLRLEALAGVPVLLSVAPSRGTTVREVLVEPVGSDRRLRYLDWVRACRERVERATRGRCGYLHIPDMGGEGLVEFVRGFYPAVRKPALIVDGRYNRGGFVSQIIIERLRRTMYAFMQPRHGQTMTYPAAVVRGPMVWLADRHAGSDGDIGPMSFRLLRRGPVIGSRTWGGVVGIRGDKRFVDGGLSTQPEFAWWEPGTGWGLENTGVEPDVAVDNGPAEQAVGLDRQLEAAIAHIQAELTRDPRPMPTPPPWPDKSVGGMRPREERR